MNLDEAIGKLVVRRTPLRPVSFNNMFIFILIFGLLFGIEGSALSGNYQYFPETNVYYKLHDIPMTWIDAVTQCHSECATLAMPRNQAEADILKKLFHEVVQCPSIEKSNHFHLGFHDQFSEGQFITEKGQPIEDFYHTWSYGKPSGSTDENCGSMQRDGKIGDLSCTTKLLFVCQKDFHFSNEPSNDTSVYPDDSAYVLEPFSQKSFKIHLNPKTWNQARVMCIAEGGQLAFIESKQEQDFLVRILTDPKNKVTNVKLVGYALLGYHDLFIEGKYFTLSGKEITPNDNFKWAPGEPNNAQTDEDCGSMRSSGHMDDFPCSYPSVFFCERAPKFENKYSYLHYPEVQSYYKLHNKPMKWINALRQCQSECATLAMPRNQKEANILKEIFKKIPRSTNTGVTDPDVLLLGFHDYFSKGQFVTEQGHPIENFHSVWGYGQPSGAADENCGSMQRNGKYDDVTCSTDAFFVCQKEDLSNENLTPNFIQLSPDSDYMLEPFSEKSFKIHLNPKTWNQARVMCIAEGGHLAFIESNQEQDFLVTILTDPKNKVTNVVYPGYALLGYHDLFKEGNYFNLKGKEITPNEIFKWAPEEPNNARPDEDCGSMRSSGLMDDFPCSIPSVFFCERPPNFQTDNYNDTYELHTDVNIMYKFHKNPMTWLDAVEKCYSECATLAMPKNQTEADVLKTIFKNLSTTMDVSQNDKVFLYFHDHFSEGYFVSENGKLLSHSYYKWAYGQPGGGSVENCGSMRRNGRIDDVSCSIKLQFVCQKGVFPFEYEELHPDSAYALEPFSQKSFKIHLNPKTWNQARVMCIAEEGQLAFIESKQEQDFLVRILTDPKNKVTTVAYPGYALLGYHDLFKKGKYFSLSGKKITPSEYFKWAPGEPNHGQPDEDCGSMRSSGLMDDFPCSVPSVFFCERQPIKDNYIDMREFARIAADN